MKTSCVPVYVPFMSLAKPALHLWMLTNIARLKDNN